MLDLNVFCMAISSDFANDETLFVGTESGIFRSTNGGRAWREVDFPTEFAPVLSLAVSPDYTNDGDGGVLLAGTESCGLFCSEDGGRTWTRLGEDVITEAVKRWVASDGQALLPEGGAITTWNDESVILRGRIDLLMRNALQGLALVFVILAAAVALLPGLGTRLVPDLSQGEFAFRLTLPEGTPLETTSQVIARIEEPLLADPRLSRVFSIIGQLPSAASGRQERGENLAQINFVLPEATGAEDQEAAVARVRQVLSLFPNADAELVHPSVWPEDPDPVGDGPPLEDPRHRHQVLGAVEGDEGELPARVPGDAHEQVALRDHPAVHHPVLVGAHHRHLGHRRRTELDEAGERVGHQQPLSIR